MRRCLILRVPTVYNISLFYCFWDAAVFSDIASTPYILYRVRCDPSYSNSITGNYPSIRKKNSFIRREKNRSVYRSHVLPSIQINPGGHGLFPPTTNSTDYFSFPSPTPETPSTPSPDIQSYSPSQAQYPSPPYHRSPARTCGKYSQRPRTARSTPDLHPVSLLCGKEGGREQLLDPQARARAA